MSQQPIENPPAGVPADAPAGVPADALADVPAGVPADAPADPAEALAEAADATIAGIRSLGIGAEELSDDEITELLHEQVLAQLDDE